MGRAILVKNSQVMDTKSITSGTPINSHCKKPISGAQEKSTLELQQIQCWATFQFLSPTGLIALFTHFAFS